LPVQGTKNCTYNCKINLTYKTQQTSMSRTMLKRTAILWTNWKNRPHWWL